MGVDGQSEDRFLLCCLRHEVPFWLKYPPRRGQKRARLPTQLSEAVIGIWGDCPPRTESDGGGGEPKSVIDSKRRRLNCLRSAVTGGRKREVHQEPLAGKITRGEAGTVTALRLLRLTTDSQHRR